MKHGVQLACGQTASVQYPAHCAGITNMPPLGNLSPAMKMYCRHSV